MLLRLIRSATLLLLLLLTLSIGVKSSLALILDGETVNDLVRPVHCINGDKYCDFFLP